MPRRIKSMKKGADWAATFGQLMEEYSHALRYPGYYSDLTPFESVEEAFYWTGDLVVEILSDIMESNLTRAREEKESSLIGRVDDLDRKMSGINCGDTRGELGKLLSDIKKGPGRGESLFLSGDRFLEVALLETEVDDLLIRQENQRLFRQGRRWELFQSTPRSWFV